VTGAEEHDAAAVQIPEHLVGERSRRRGNRGRALGDRGLGAYLLAGMERLAKDPVEDRTGRSCFEGRTHLPEDLSLPRHHRVETGGYPYFIQAYGKAVWDVAPRSPITAADVAVAAPEAEAELAVGFFGSRFERATPGERDYLRAMAETADALGAQGADLGTEWDMGGGSVPTADVAAALGKRPQSLSPARDALLKKGLI
jgi:hypothetical protein